MYGDILSVFIAPYTILYKNSNDFIEQWLISECLFKVKYPISCEPIWGSRNPKFGVWMHLVMTECRIEFWVAVTLPSDLDSRIIASGIYILYYFRYWNGGVSRTFLVTVTLTSDLVSRIIVTGTYLLYYCVLGILNLVCGCNFAWRSIVYTLGSL